VRAPRLFRALVAAAGGLLLAGGAALPAAASSAPAADDRDEPAVVALDAAGVGVDDFVFASFDGVYELSRGDDGRSRLHTVETLVAVFPEYDQNRGIRRALVSDYKGHSTDIRIVSVTDGNGVPRSYDVETDDEGFTLVTIAVPQGQYVHGEQTYVIEYTQSDVTATSTDTADGVTRDEFYWDTNGTGWRQPFGEVTATVRVAADLMPALTGDAYCYYGYANSTDRCEISSSGGEFRASVNDLFAGQNMTVAIGFQQGTFAGAPFWTYVPILALIAIALVLFGLVYALITRFVLWRDAPGRGIVIAQYEPAEGMSAMLAANIVGKPRKGMAATIVDLAVRKNLRILEHDQGWSKVFGVQRLSNEGLGPDEQRVMGALFSINPFAMGGLPGLQSLFQVGGRMPQPQPDPAGEVRWLTKGDTVLGQQVVALTKAVEREVEAGGLRRKPSWSPMLLVIGSMVLAGILLIIQTIVGSGETSIVVGVVGLNLVPWIAIFAAGLLARRRPLTAKGSELKEHLEGLREFIRVAEADRLQMLQSVSGAERIPTGDGAAIVKIYERLLPYALLFGLEKEWAQEIAKYYDTNPPDWYSGSSGFSIGAFAAGISTLSSTVSTSYSGSSSSSSSGGGGGGGSSGGGGGGGGGGGV
jgi:Predicted membrane protein